MKNSMDKTEAIEETAIMLLKGENQKASEIISKEYPFQPIKRESRCYTIKQMMQIFYRDGFVDRYSGKKLINPGMLRVLSEKMPKEFPYQAHWKTDECHIAYWECQPTVDHIYPIALGGKDDITNWVTTSMINNSVKSNWTLEQLNWKLVEPGNIDEWDGLSKIFVKIVDKDQSLLKIKKIKEWYKETLFVLQKG